MERVKLPMDEALRRLITKLTARSGRTDGPFTAEIDENDVVQVLNCLGRPVAWMSRAQYERLAGEVEKRVTIGPEYGRLEAVDAGSAPSAALAASPDALASVHAVRSELGLTRPGRIRSFLRDENLWRLMTAIVVASRPIEARA